MAKSIFDGKNEHLAEKFANNTQAATRGRIDSQTMSSLKKNLIRINRRAIMIKKRLSTLAGTIFIATSSDAAILWSSGFNQLGASDTLAVFNTTGAGSYYQFVSGSNGDSLASGNGFFSIDVSAASAALGGIESFALLAVKSEVAPPCPVGVHWTPGCYNYSEYIYVSQGGGLVFAGNPITPTSNALAKIQIYQIQNFLNNANIGLNSEGSLGDFDRNASVSSLLNFANTGLAINAQQGGFANETNLQLLPGQVFIAGDTFNYNVPVPAAAWLFGSALIGLSALRRRRD